MVKSDNGPPFNGDEFAKFAQVLGFKHRKATPLWPSANGEVERFVNTLHQSCEEGRKELEKGITYTHFYVIIELLPITLPA